MTFHLLCLFLLGAALCLSAYLARKTPTLRNLLAGLGMLLMIAPLAIIIYFLVIIFTSNTGI